MYINILVKIKNAERAGKKQIKVPHTKIGSAVLSMLEKFQFVKRMEVKGRNPKKYIEVELNEEKPIKGIKILSKSSRRMYAGYRDLRRVKGGKGIIILSTPKGIVSDREARKEKVGGEVLCEVW